MIVLSQIGEMIASEIANKDKFTCRIQGVSVTGVVNKGREYIHLCQNRSSNNISSTKEMNGYKHVWSVYYSGSGDRDLDPYFRQNHVTDFRITNKKATPKVAVPKKTVVKALTPEQKLAKAQKELAEAQAELAKQAATRDPQEVPGGWRIYPQSNNSFNIGCGAVNVTREEAAKFANIMEQILARRAVFENTYVGLISDLTKITRVAARLGKVTLKHI